MADNITDLEGLRLIAWSLEGGNATMAAECRLAADEIELLRAEVERKADYAERMDALAEERLIESNRLRAAGDALVESLDHSRADIRSAVAAWEEARRG